MGFTKDLPSKMLNRLNEEIYIVDQRGAICYVNRIAETLFFVDVKDVIGKSFFDLPYTVASGNLDKNRLKELVVAGAEVHEKGEIYTCRGNDQQSYDELLIDSYCTEDGIKYYQVTISNMTERKVNEERLNTLTEALPDSVFMKDGSGKWEYINTVAKNTFRLSDLDWKGKTDLELAGLNAPLKGVHLNCVDTDAETWANKKQTRFVERIIDPTGEIHIYDVVKVPLFNENGSRKRIVIVAQDVTERNKLEEEKNVDHGIQSQLNRILKLSLGTGTIKEILDQILEEVICSSFINLQRQGGIFLTDERKKVLNLESQFNLPPELQTMCAHVEFGKCVCGKAAQDRSTIYLDQVNEQHEYVHASMAPHGHYGVPITLRNEMLGVIIVYLDKGHRYNNKEVQFLESVADIIAGMIYRKRAEQQVVNSVSFLEKLERVNKVLEMTNSDDDLGAMNKQMLQTMLEIFGSDRAYLLYPCDPDAPTWQVPMECTVKEYPGAFEIGKNFPVTEEFKFIFRSALSTDDPLVYDRETMSPEDYEMSKMFSIQSAIQIALHPKKGKPWIVGMHQCSYPRIWTVEERNLFKQIAQKFSHSLNSFLLLDELRKSEAQYRSLSETAHDIIVSYGTDGSIEYMNSVGLQFLGLDEHNYRGKNVFDFIPEEEKPTITQRITDRVAGLKQPKLVEVDLLNSHNVPVRFEVNTSSIQIDGEIKGMISVNRDITERRLAAEKLIQQNTELQTINAELDRFVYSTSHDLRAPLTSVMGLIHLTKEIAPKDSEVVSYLEMMETSVQRLDGVIKSILDYSRSNRIKIKNEPIDVNKIYNEVIDGIHYIKDMDTIQLSASIDREHPFVSDKMSITTIISNLVTNAVKYRRRDGTPTVKFSFSVGEKEGIITVEDNGEGIPADKFDKIFEMFYRNSASSEGSGLGLYITKQNVTKLKGRIDLKSEKGNGSTFTVHIPNNAATS